MSVRVGDPLDPATETGRLISTPFGGFEQSGLGRELALRALAGYSEMKNVFVSTDA